jgi:cytochrome bd-type quinol oxidase subunit 2
MFDDKTLQLIWWMLVGLLVMGWAITDGSSLGLW